jgi:hypothetical protein
MRFGLRFRASLLPGLLFLTDAAFAQGVWFAPTDNLPRWRYPRSHGTCDIDTTSIAAYKGNIRQLKTQSCY